MSDVTILARAYEHMYCSRNSGGLCRGRSHRSNSRASKVTAPVLVVHTENDTAVPIALGAGCMA